MSEMAEALQAEDAVKRFGSVTALDGVSLDLGSDELLALVGPSGCGKSTLLRAIAGLVSLDGGRLTLNGTVVDDGQRRLPPEHRRVGLVFQEHSLFPHLTVSKNIVFGIRDESRGEAKRRVDEALELVELSGYGDRFPHELSGGERQRVSLARALAPRPALLLLDEPFASLDPNLRVQLRGDVVAALRATKTPAVFVTHEQTEALAVGDRVAVMRAGKIEQLASPEEIFHRPTNRFVAAFMGEAAFLPIEAGTTTLGAVDMSHRRSATIAMVRPDDVLFTPAAVDSGHHGDFSDDEIVASEFRGATWYYTVKLSDGNQVYAVGSHLDPHEVGDRGRLEMMPGHRLIAVADETQA